MQGSDSIGYASPMLSTFFAICDSNRSDDNDDDCLLVLFDRWFVGNGTSSCTFVIMFLCSKSPTGFIGVLESMANSNARFGVGDVITYFEIVIFFI